MLRISDVDNRLTIRGVQLMHVRPNLLLPQAEQSFRLDRPLREVRNTFEKSYFEFHLSLESRSMTRVAETTGLERTHL